MHTPPSWRDADAETAVRAFFLEPEPRRTATRQMMREMLSGDPFARRCAADLARRVSARKPEILRTYVGVFADLLAELPLEEWQARGYLTLAAALNATTHAERVRLVGLVRRMAGEQRIALRAIGVEAFVLLAAAEPELQDEALVLLERCRRSGSQAERSRARRMLPVLMAASQ